MKQQKLQEIINATSQSITKESGGNPLALENQSFGIINPITANKIPCRKLEINGAVKGNYFEFPSLATSTGQSLFIEQDFKYRVISKIEACVGVGIYSLRVTYSDGTESPLIGNRNPNSEVLVREAGADESMDPAQIASIDIQAWGTNYVQVINFKDFDDQLVGSVAC